MVDVDGLSDAELRSKLLEYGFPVMPITGTTRKVMVKKLKMLMEAKKKSGNQRKSLGRFSSDDDSDTDSVKKQAKLKRQTIASASLMQPPASPSLSKPAEKRKDVKTTVTTRTSRILQHSAAANNEFDTGSESDEVAEQFDKPYQSKTIPASYLSASSAADTASDRINQIRSRLSTSLYAAPSSDLQLDSEENTPFLSNFTKRLSQLSDNNSSRGSSSHDYLIKENDVTNGNGSARSYMNNYRATSLKRRTLAGPNYGDYKSSQQPQASNMLKNNLVPIAILIVAFLFLIVVVGIYLGIKSDVPQELIVHLPQCTSNNKNVNSVNSCLTEMEAKPAQSLYKVLRNELETLAIANQCESSKIKPFMSNEEIVDHMLRTFAVKNATKIRRDLANLAALTFVNPHLGLNVVKFDAGTFQLLETVHEMKDNTNLGLIMTTFRVSWACYLRTMLGKCLSLLSTVICAFLLLYAGNYAFKWWRQRQIRQQQEELALVEHIIDIMQTTAAESDAYLVINHVRDMILQPAERRTKQKLWKRAVEYIESNESRIRREEQVVQGETVEVWRWLGSSVLNRSSAAAAANKSWQGQAFETQTGSVNSLPCSPTPCLKIRGIIEEGDRSKHQIRKAVLSKCEESDAACRILHCGVDLNSKCVYLKCQDQSDAAVAYRNLHGWWYAGNLVTVKYLRVERYMQRFPDAPASGPPYLQQ